MTTFHPVPADDDAETIIDLVQDCREISGVLGSFVPTVIVIPDARGAMPAVEISRETVDSLVGYGDYGS
jgi:hypothetical protein